MASNPSTTLQTQTEFENLKTKLLSILRDPQYLSYHLHVTFEINFEHLFSNVLASQQTRALSDKKQTIYNLVKHLETEFGLNNFTIISLPLTANSSYIQYLTTCKFSASSQQQQEATDDILLKHQVFTYFTALSKLQETNIINAIGFKIEGVVFPSKKPRFVQQIEANPSVSPTQLAEQHPDFCYFETHRKVPTVTGLKLQPNELISYSFKNQCYMSAFREYTITSVPNIPKYEVCIYEVWVNDIEAEWKKAQVTDGDFVTKITIEPLDIEVQEEDLVDFPNQSVPARHNNVYNHIFIKALEQIQLESN